MFIHLHHKHTSGFTRLLLVLFLAALVLTVRQSQKVLGLYGRQQGMVAGESVINMSASVPENPYNTALKELQLREQLLIQKEQELRSLETRMDSELQREQQRLNLLMIVVAALFFMVLANSYLDYRRTKQAGLELGHA